MDGDQALRNASEMAFPSSQILLRTWYVAQCVRGKCKGVVGKEVWKEFEAAGRRIFEASTHEVYTCQWTEFKAKYSNEKTQTRVSYLENVWFRVGQRERLLKFYTNEVLHFGMITTSWVESAHAYINRYLGETKSQGSLYISWSNSEKAVINYNEAIAVRTNIALNYMPVDMDKKLFQGCIDVVTWSALRLFQKSIDSSTQPLAPCTGVFNRTMGISCIHTSERKLRVGGLGPSDFKPHWYWDRNSPSRPLLDPVWAGKNRMSNVNSEAHSRTGRILSVGEQ